MKIKFPIFFLCLCAFVALTSCSKAPQTSGPSSVHGQAIDQTTGKGVPHAIVYLLSQSNGAVGAWGMKQLQDTIADANGNFSFTFNYVGGNTYSIAAQAANYYTYGNVFPTLSQGKIIMLKLRCSHKDGYGFIW